MAEAGRVLLMYFVLPAWLLVGLGDWACHRATRIEQTSGPTESVFHLLGLAEMGLAVLCALILEINALAIAVMLAAFMLHALTVWLDVRYTNDKREIMPVEQSLHSYMEGLPLLGLGILVTMHFDQFQALFGFGAAAADFTLRLKAEPLPAAYVVTAIAASFVFGVLPFTEELVRGIRARRRGPA